MIDWSQAVFSDFRIDLDWTRILMHGNQVYFNVNIRQKSTGAIMLSLNEGIASQLYQSLMGKPDGETQILEIMRTRARDAVANKKAEASINPDTIARFKNKAADL